MSNKTSTIEELKDQLDIVTVIGNVVPLKKAGVNYKGICPFHNEKTPSFIVSEQKQIFTCFGCGASGNVIEFTKKYYNLDFKEAVEKLAKENGIDFSFQTSENGKKRDKYYELNKEAARFFYNTFISGKNPGYTYMKSRQIDDSILKKFGIGFADDSWDKAKEYFKDKADLDTLIDLGIVSKNEDKVYDKFRNRVIFPIINTSGKVTGFTGRTINDGIPKYLNSPENIVFQKKNNLYGINLAKQEIGKSGYAILVEGNIDVISLYQAGVKNVVATCGTALTENQAKLLKKYTGNVILSYDSDEAGIKATMRGIDILSKEGINVKVIHVTDGKDPDDFIKEHGKDAYLGLIDNALPSIEYKLNYAKKGLEIGKEIDKIEYIKRVTSILKGLSPTTQDIYINKLSKELKVSESAFKQELNDVKDIPNISENRNEESKEVNNILLSKVEATLIKVLFINSSFVEKIIEYDNIFVSSLGIKIKNIMFDLYSMNGTFEESDIYDRLEIDESKYLLDTIKNIIISGNEELVFEETINSWKLLLLQKKERDLIDRLSLTSDEDDNEVIKKLGNELMEVQKKINTLRRV